MVIDTSALIAILLNEPEADKFIDAIAKSSERFVSVFSILEAGIVIQARKGIAGKEELDHLISHSRIKAVALNQEQMEIALEAWQRFGKGRHPAGLNIGDCCSYALAKYSGEPLLFKGDDFGETDITMVFFENTE